MRYFRSVLFLIALNSVIQPALAQFQQTPTLSVYPETPSKAESYLILITDVWSDSCGGTVTIEATQTSVEILASLASPILGAPCATALLPFQQLVYPPDHTVAAIEFNDVVTVNYRRDNGSGPELVSSVELKFGANLAPSAAIQTGSWVARDLESSGLFIDQQGDVLTAALLDYGEDGQAFWHYTSGRFNGPAFVGSMTSYTEVVCVTEPCPRAAPGRSGRVRMLARDYNDLLVQYDDVLVSGTVSEQVSYEYSRLELARSAELGDVTIAIPDLVGDWVVGVRGDQNNPDDFRSVRIDLMGPDDQAGLRRYVYEVLSIAQDAAAADFRIVCEDARPVDGGLACFLDGYRYSDQGCNAAFAFSSVGWDHASGLASCGDGATPLQTRYEMYRLR